MSASISAFQSKRGDLQKSYDQIREYLKGMALDKYAEFLGLNYPEVLLEEMDVQFCRVGCIQAASLLRSAADDLLRRARAPFP
jgi:hypothetical protein